MINNPKNLLSDLICILYTYSIYYKTERRYLTYIFNPVRFDDVTQKKKKKQHKSFRFIII